MAGNSFGQAFRITTAGESHGPAEVLIIDGVPPGLPLGPEDFVRDLGRRRPGQSSLTSARKESDEAELLSGVFEGRTTGTSLAVLVRNRDVRSKDYEDIKEKYRPGHADFTFDRKYGHRDWRGGGRASARETVMRVAAGVVAKKVLDGVGVRVQGYVLQIGTVKARIEDPTAVEFDAVEATPARCPDPGAAARMVEAVEAARKQGDSLGGIAEFVAAGVPPGWGEPVFDKLKADLAKALFSLPAVMGVEYGAGFAAASARGSELNDPFENRGGRIRTASNRHGGMLGGISSGMPLVLRCAVKPTSSLPREQATVTRAGTPTTIVTRGRHDPCVLPRFVPVGEAMIAITLADHYLRHRAQNPERSGPEST